MMDEGLRENGSLIRMEGYKLAWNPFRWFPEYYIEEERQPSLAKYVYQRELNRIAARVFEKLSRDDYRPLWLWFDEAADLFYQIDFFTLLYRFFLFFEGRSRFQPVNVMEQHMRESPLNGIFRKYALSFEEGVFKDAFMSFFFAQLERLSEEGGLEQVFPEGKRLLEEKNRDDFLEKVLMAPFSKEFEEDEKEIERARLREKVIRLTEKMIMDKKLGEGLNRALSRAFNWQDWSQGVEALRTDPVTPNEVRGSLVGLVEFISYANRQSIIFFSHLERILEWDEEVAARLLSSIYEVSILLKGKALSLFLASAKQKNALKTYLMGEDNDISFKYLLYNQPENYEGFRGMVAYALKRDVRREKVANEVGEVYPFTEEALEFCYERLAGNVVKTLDILGQALEEGAHEEYPQIDKKFLQDRLHI